MDTDTRSRVQAVLRAPGNPLPVESRAFFETRFGQGFDKVRIHTGAAAEAAAEAVDAKAFTVGRSIVFGAGRFSPGSGEGRRLLGHELTHVVQQASTPIGSTQGVLQRAPDKTPRAERRRERRLQLMAKWPSRAHFAWSKLNATDRNGVVLRMASRYGIPFARKFLLAVEKVKKKDIFQSYFGPGAGPKPAKISGRGYRLAQRDSAHEWWVHPTGRSITRNHTKDQPGQVAPAREEESPGPAPPSPKRTPESESSPSLSPRCRQVEMLAQSICDNAERICSLAEQLDEEEALATCERARASCREARDQSTACSFEERRVPVG